jgi:hypothetical protein
MQTITLRLPRPTPAQRIILESPQRYKVLNCGRRFGKTELFVNIACNGNSPHTNGALQGLPIAYVSLTYKNVKEFWGRLKSTLPSELIAQKNEVDMLLSLITGGSVECWTFEKFVSARGRAYAGIILDEAAITPNLQEAWEEVFQAMLLDYKGWGVLGSSPNGFNHFHTMYGYGLNEELEEWESFHYTSYDNPYIDPHEIDKLKQTISEDTFKREYLAEFSAGGGGVFVFKEDTFTAPLNPKYNPAHTYTMGIDWGQSDDSTVASVFDATDYCEVDMLRMSKMDYLEMIEKIAQLAFQWHVEKIIPERNSMSTNISFLAKTLDAMEWPIDPRTKYPSNPTVQAFNMDIRSKGRLVNLMINGIETGLKLQDIPVANHEMRAYVSVQKEASGLWTYSHPPNGHDDTVIARLLAHAATYELKA